MSSCGKRIVVSWNDRGAQNTLRMQPHVGTLSAVSPVVSLARGDGAPVFPLLRHLSENIAHDHGAGHQAMALSLQDSDLAPAHGAAKPLHVVDGYAGVPAAVVD